VVERDLAGVGVDLDLADAAAIEESRLIGREAAGALQADTELRRQPDRDEVHLRDFGNQDTLRENTGTS
jgi:hypothetical protein